MTSSRGSKSALESRFKILEGSSSTTVLATIKALGTGRFNLYSQEGCSGKCWTNEMSPGGSDRTANDVLYIQRTQ